jgi:predicted transposase YbfD/YdcC
VKLESLIEVRAQRQVGNETMTKVRYCLSSLDGTANAALRITRTHRSIENSMSWVLGVAFREDDSGVRTDYGR